ncbi:hypothetical protein RF11_06591 [Thelohanellus kitauei]|uniref:Uncharacterized protein n=1 Tax=Thelohanellus kitauei TaxID=669202 RepID=A0A0C2IV10_THEKT|nr:hypothetical protein RF11_06591 [Thelohanellus kitauei]
MFVKQPYEFIMEIIVHIAFGLLSIFPIFTVMLVLFLSLSLRHTFSVIAKLAMFSFYAITFLKRYRTFQFHSHHVSLLANDSGVWSRWDYVFFNLLLSYAIYDLFFVYMSHKRESCSDWILISFAAISIVSLLTSILSCWITLGLKYWFILQYNKIIFLTMYAIHYFILLIFSALVIISKWKLEIPPGPDDWLLLIYYIIFVPCSITHLIFSDTLAKPKIMGFSDFLMAFVTLYFMILIMASILGYLRVFFVYKSKRLQLEKTLKQVFVISHFETIDTYSFSLHQRRYFSYNSRTN